MQKTLFSFILAFAVFFTMSIRTYASDRLWEFQSIDTMKYSRDVAREKLRDSSYDLVIKKQVKDIAETGATHIAIGTPYDDEFIPFTKRWVDEARAQGLSVWFRGNFSGWEEWFSYKSISRAEHTSKIKRFIESNPDLFEDGDIFTSCPECENGGPGDPRATRDIEGFRKFLIDEHEISKKSFASINKNVKTNYFSMNGDVARLIMDRETTAKLDGILVVDHYVKTGEQLSLDITDYANISGGKVVLGEFGAPIPDIHGVMSKEDQALWLKNTMALLSENKDLVGLNYWTSLGGSTAIWNDDGTSKPAVQVLKEYFQPKRVSGLLLNELGNPIQNAEVTAGKLIVRSDNQGSFSILVAPHINKLLIRAENYEKMEFLVEDKGSYNTVLEKENESFFFWLAKNLKRILLV